MDGIQVDQQQLDGLFGNVLDFMDSSIAEQAKLEQEKQALVQRLSTADSILLEKVAAAKSSALDPDRVNTAVDRLVSLQIIPLELHAKVASQLRKDPNSALSLLAQVAESLSSAPAEGYGVQKEASATTDDSDPDGWGDVLAGRVPKIKP